MILEEHGKHIAKLSINDKKLRDLYLRDLALGTIQGPPTGYVSIDKPWLKYYSGDFLLQDMPKTTIYEYLKQQTRDNLQDTAITYFGRKISYKKMFQKIDEASKVLTMVGVSSGDRIMYLMPNIPETAYLLYGGSQIGAISDYVDPRPDSVDLNVSAKKILSLIKEEKIKHLVVLDQCYLGMIKPIEQELKKLGLEKVIIVSPEDSMNFSSKLNYVSETIRFNGIDVAKQKIKRTKEMTKLMKKAKQESCLELLAYTDLVENSKNVEFNPAEYEPSKVDIIVHTSGTSSSKPKPIPLTNDNLNSYVHQTYGANMPMLSGDKVLHILPYFAAFGIVDVVHAGLCHSNNLIQVPEFAPANLGKLVLKHKPQTIIGTPTWFLSLIEDPILQDADLSFLKMITYGGDSMDKNDEKKINEFLNKHNCSANVTKGHGMSEICGCGSYAANEYNILGSMGVPMPNTTYAIVDPETKKMVRFGKDDDYVEGEIIILSDSVTPGILDDQIIVQHAVYHGDKYIYTKDIARMDKNGVLTFLSRSDRSFTRFDGFKYKSYEVEEVIKKHDEVKYCVISPFYDEEKFGNMPIADIVLNDEKTLSDTEKTSIVEDIVNKCFINNPNVSARQIPTKFRFRNSLPLTANGKVDFKSLAAETLDGSEVSVIIEETNISIDGIKIIPPTNKQKIKKKTNSK